MSSRRSRLARLPRAALCAGFALSLACTAEPLTNFGPPGGLSGKELPPGTTGPSDGGGGDGSMKKCVYKAPPDAGPADAGVSEATPGEAAAGEGGPGAEAGGAPEGGPPDSGTGGTCSVTWTKDLFPNMTAAGPWQCASSSCHGGGGVAGPVLNDDPTASYDALAAYKTQLTTPSLPYILPCVTDPAKSAFLCNTSGAKCGPQMPLTTNGAHLLSAKQVTMIQTWIACGALDD